MTVDAGLVLEGGGMKGVYTAGVLDFFLDQDMMFKNCYGVSMGACTMCSYIAKQRKRGYDVVVDYLENKDYCSMRSLIKTGDMFNADLIYNKVPNEWNPYDYETANAHDGKAVCVLTDVETGRPYYHQFTDLRTEMQYLRASASLPLISKMVEIDGRKYLDGGMSDSIPIMYSLKDGNKKNVIIMTKEVGYRRQPSEITGAIKVRYKDYPYFVHDMCIRHTRYNRVLDFIEKEEKRGNLFVIRPQHKSEVGRIEKDRDKLQALYEEGYEEAKQRFEDLQKYLATVQ